MEEDRGTNMDTLELINFEQELFTLDSEEVAERIQRGPLTRWEEERWNSLEETLFLKLRDMGGLE